MSDSAAPTGTLEVAMAQALRLLDQDPTLAFEQAREILTVHPGHPAALVLPAAAAGPSPILVRNSSSPG